MSEPPSPPQFSEEEMRALEAEMERISVDDILIQTTVTLLNLAARKAGLAAPPGQGPEPDWQQVRQAIDAARVLVPLLEPRHADQLGPVRDTLSQLQLIYAQRAGGAAAPSAGPEEPGGPAQPGGAEPPPPGAGQPGPVQPGEAGPAQRSGRLWVPGQ
jgi:hypothetical protein